MNVRTKAKGFTIIEVVLVLAIAGLIFLMVFIALPALQRSQRDSARKSEVGTVTSAITSYMSNNRNAIPTASAIGQYVTSKDSDTLDSGAQIIRVSTAYSTARNISSSINVSGTDANTVYSDQIKVYFGYKCGDAPDSQGRWPLTRGTNKQAAVVVALESGPANGTVYCQTN